MALVGQLPDHVSRGCSPAKSVTLGGLMEKPPLRWQKVKVLTSLGKMHQSIGVLP